MTSGRPSGPAPPSPVAYTPIACGLYDVLEATAVRGRPVRVAYTDDTGREVVVETVIADVGSRGGAEFVWLGSGAVVRADRIVRVGETAFLDEACPVPAVQRPEEHRA